MAVTQDPTRLGCGRTIDSVWDTIHEQPDEHQRECPECQRARASLQDVAQATAALRQHEASDPALQPGPRLLSSVMDLVRAEVRRGQQIPLVVETPLELTISEQSVIALVWSAADSIPGVRSRRCRVSVDQAAQTDGRPATVDVSLRLTVSADTAIPPTLEALRHAIRELVAAETGLTVRQITLGVEDVFDE